ncbi:beta strand repeat-containing protein [Listeria newyorkensis]|uniref:Uncharacterized protein n=1 Tax=Listeria newyorkensis TaxID=1497681 RepID=A0A841YXB6_9LIST|nr:toxin Cry1Ac domain D-VI-related protein [Listeria newyorkensis]MBC1457948.1 hypothetical protein [Listeria newyorkensis]
MKQNMKKIAIALVATNVLASTVITALPPVQTHAAENKLATTLKATQGQELIDDALASAQAAVKNLFGNSPTNTVLKDATTQALVDAVSAQVNALPASTDKTALQADVAKAQNILNKREEVKASIVTFYLSHDNKPVLILNKQKAANFSYCMIEDSTTTSFARAYADINNGIDTIGYNTTIMDKNGLLTVSCTSAVSLSNRFFMQTFTADSAPLATGTFYPTAYTQIVSEAKTAVNELFISNNTANHIKDTTNQAAIDAAQAKVDLVTEATQKAELQVSVDKAQSELAAKNAMATATTAVNNLFSNAPTNTVLKDTTTQAMIDAASALVNALPASADKTKLAGDVTTANTLFNQIATTSISALTADSTTVSGKGEPNAAIVIKNGATTIASGKVDANGNYSLSITKQAAGSTITATVTKASNNKTSSASTVVTDDALAIAKASVNNLFTDAPTNTILKGDTTPTMIDAASVLVNALPASADKTKLQNDIATANSLAKARFVSLSTIYLEDGKISGTGTPNLSVGLNIFDYVRGTISASKTIVIGADGKFTTDLNGFKIMDPGGNLVTPSGTADIQLGSRVRLIVPGQGEISSTQFVTSHYTEASTAVNNLFSNAPTNTILKDTTTQAMIDAASALVNVLPASADKTKLAGDVTTANTLFNQIATTSIGALTTDSMTVSGKGEPNAAIVIKNGATTIASGKVASDGNYSFTIAKQPANSTITATVTKASNNKTSSASTIVKDEAIVTTTIDALTNDSTSVSGKGEPNADIVIKNGATTIASGKVAGDGNYLFFIPTQAAGSSITATVTKTSNGKMSSATTTIVDNSIVTTTIDTLTTDSTSISGKGEPNATIVIKNGSTTIASGKVASDGTYYFNITKQAAGSTITATVTKTSNGKTSAVSTTVKEDPLSAATASVNALFADAPTNSVLKDTTTQAMIDAASVKVNELSRNLPEKVDLQADIAKANTLFNQIAVTTINTLTETSTTVSGKGEPNADVVIKNGSTTIASGKVSSDGNYSFTIAKQAGGSIIVATVTKAANGKTSSASTTIPVVIDYSLAANSYKIGTANLTGTYGKNISKVRLFVNGTLIVQATTNNGTFTFANIASYITKPTDKVEVVGVDGAYVERARVAVTVTGDPVYDYSLTANDYTLGNATLTGKYGKDVSKVRLWVNNVVVAQATTNADGTYSFDKVPSFVKLATDKVEVVGVNAAYNEVARKTVVTKGASILDTSITPNSYAKDSANLTGTYGKDISKVRLWVNGVVVAQASTSGTNFTFTNIASFIKNKTDVVEVVGVDAQYKELNRKAVTLTGFDVLDNSLTAPATYTLDTDKSITGTFGSNISKVRLYVNGVVKKQASTVGNTYTLAGAEAYITSTSDVVEVVGVDAQYKEVARKTVTVKNNSTNYDYSLTVNPYTFGATSISGAYGKDVSAVRLWVNGVAIKTATLKDGTFTLNGLAGITSTSDLVEIVAVNSSYKEVQRIVIQ